MTIKLSENETELPSYDQNVENTAPTGSHVHLSPVVHWYISSDESDGTIAVGGNMRPRRSSFVSFATQTSKEVKYELNQIITEIYKNRCDRDRRYNIAYKPYKAFGYLALDRVDSASDNSPGDSIGFKIGCIIDIRPGQEMAEMI